MTKNIITWDLGGTKCAAGLVGYDEHGALRCHETTSIKLASVTSLHELIERIEHNLAVRHHEVDAVSIGAAGIYDGNMLRLENGYPFSMPIAHQAQAHKWPRYFVVHDYVPIICASFYPTLKTLAIHEGHPDPLGRRVAFGIGTGLGLKDGVLLPHGDIWLGHNEMGHIGLSLVPSVPKHLQSINQKLCQQGFSFENVLSGSGMLWIEQFFRPNTAAQSPEQLGVLIRQGDANDTLHCFAFYVGLFSAVVQLCFMPSGGIWMAGGILLKHPELFLCHEYQQGLQALSAYQAERQRFPIRLITDRHAAFLGAAYYAIKKLPSEL